MNHRVRTLLMIVMGSLFLPGCLFDWTGGRLGVASFPKDQSEPTSTQTRLFWLPGIVSRLRSDDTAVQLNALKTLDGVVKKCDQLSRTMNCLTGFVPGKIGADRASERIAHALEQAMLDQDVQVRVNAATLYLRLPGNDFRTHDRAVSVIAEPLQNKDPQVRLAAVERLSNLNVEEATSPILDASQDKDINVRTKAVESLAQKTYYLFPSHEKNRVKVISMDIVSYIMSIEDLYQREHLSKNALKVFERLECFEAIKLLKRIQQKDMPESLSLRPSYSTPPLVQGRPD